MAGRAGTDVHEVHKAADARQGAAQQMGQELGLLHVDAQHIGAGRVAAHRVEAAAQLAPLQQDKQQDHNQDGNHHPRFHIGRNVYSPFIDTAHAGDINPDGFQRLEPLVGHVKLGGVDNGCHALGKEHTGQGHNEGLNIQVSNQEALNQAKGNADAQRNEQSGKDAAALVVQVDGAAHTHQRRQRTNGNINAAGNHHDAHTAGQNDEGRVFIEDVEECLGLPEAGAQHHNSQNVHQKEYHNGDGQQQVGIGHTAAFRQTAIFYCNFRCHITLPPLQSSWMRQTSSPCPSSHEPQEPT